MSDLTVVFRQPQTVADSHHTPGHSVRVDRIASIREPWDLARLAREAATDIDRGHPVEGLRRLVAIGGLAKVLADRIEARQ